MPETRMINYSKDLQIRNAVDLLTWRINNNKPGKYTLEKCVSLKDMLTSEDSESVDLALEILNTYRDE